MSRHYTTIAALLTLSVALCLALPALAQGPAVVGTAAFVDRAGESSIGMPICRSGDTGLEETPAVTRTVKIEGTVEVVHEELPGTMIVSGQEVVVTADTILWPTDVEIEQGDYCVVHAVVDGTVMTATNIRVYKDGPLGDAIEFRGMISEHPPAPYLGHWTVAGQTVIVTDVRAPSGNEPALGYFAHVIGSVQADQTILAESVDVLRPDQVAGRFEFEGEIEVEGQVPGDWTIGGVTAWVEVSTELVGDIVAGAVAQVSGHQTTAGSLVFDKIIVAEQALELIVIRGLIEEISVEEDGYGWWQVDGQTIEVDAQTFIDESYCRAVLGMQAEVVARPGPLLPYALRIRVERPE